MEPVTPPAKPPVDYMAWIRWILTLATVIVTFMASTRKDPIVIPPPPAATVQYVPYHATGNGGGCQCVIAEKVK